MAHLQFQILTYSQAERYKLVTKGLLYLETYTSTPARRHHLPGRWYSFVFFLPDFDTPLPRSPGQVTSPHRQCFCVSSPFETYSLSLF
jgi:hypothetical protein